MRINKYLAHCGIASRRKSEEIILDGRVTVNNEIIIDLSYLVQDSDRVEIDGDRIKVPSFQEYYILHKPKGYICSNSDELGRKNITSLIKTKERIYSVGRLDKDTTGLILLTNDGEFTNRVLHPKYRITRKYYAYTKEMLALKDISKIKKGIFLRRGERAQADIKHMDFVKGKHKWRIILKEGKNREIRRIFHRFDIKVYNLHRYAFGKLTLKGIDKGHYRQIKNLNIESII
tara:strand:- start:123 stop:818 length:696 start_codon:yes stop_codon:yes gene_type:complete